MSEPDTRPRLRCDRCQRPQSHCLCAHIPALSTRTRVLVLQHPDEARHPLNTARLAVLGLQHAQLWVGERFPQLAGELAGADDPVLLFPAAEGDPVFAEPVRGEAGRGLLVVPDGTWRKARQIVRANPELAGLPRLSLPAGAPSAYRVRRASEPAAVSTIEAIVRALGVLEPERDVQSLLAPFQRMVQQQIDAMGEETFRRNHQR